MAKELAQQLYRHLDAWGIELRSAKPLGTYEDYEFGTVELFRGRQHERMTAVRLPEMTLSSLARAMPRGFRQESSLIAFGSRITPRAAEAMRTRGVNFLDQAGNAYIRFGEVLIDVRGRSAPRSSDVRATRGPRRTLFTPRRAQVIFSLLVWPELVECSMQDIAYYSRSSAGQVHDTIRMLIDRGFMVSRRDRTLRRKDVLTDLWTAEYASGLGAPSNERRFRGNVEHLTMVENAVGYVSGEAALPDIRHQTLTLYTPEFDARLVGANRWRRAEDDANVFVRPQFWINPDRPAEDIPLGSVLRAPELLIYADLMASGEARQVETAKELRHVTALQATA